MRIFSCPTCSNLLHFENTRCLRCESVVEFDPARMAMAIATEQTRCGNADIAACNWRVDPGQTLCRSCAMTSTRPSDSQLASGAARLFAQAEIAKRRLVFQLLTLGLPLDGLHFDLLDSGVQRVTTGHADGLITLDLAEADAVYRTRMQTSFAEPYRTVLGHFRHESGHWFQQVLLTDEEAWSQCRALFGDDRLDYSAALEAHYGSTDDGSWHGAYVSHYASAHPWEDWAETFAHVLHILDTMETAAAFGVRAERALHAEAPLAVHHQPMEDLLREWLPLSAVLNALNRSMGHEDLYPFTISDVVAAKLAFIRDRIRSAQSGTDAGLARLV